MADSRSSSPRRRSEGSLQAVGVARSFKGVKALQGVDLELSRHEVVGLIGPNGAGKTTLINVITGFDLPTSGAVALAGEDVTRWTAIRRARAGLARTFQHGHLFANLTVRENVELGALGVGARGAEARQRADDLLDKLELRHRADQPAASLPHGDERKVGVARALAGRPRFVLMDEPAAGLPDSDVETFVALVRSVRDEYEAGVLVIDHNMGLIMEVCDRIVVLDGGRTLAHGTPKEIRRNIDVAAAYLGSSGVVAEQTIA
jgi:branched-chain amino acid transport system ATP-binding protein